MPVHNADIARAFEEIADLLEIRGDNPFRVRAYRNAARTVGEFGRELAALAAGEEPPKPPGIGVDLSAKIREIAADGENPFVSKCCAGVAVDPDQPCAMPVGTKMKLPATGVLRPSRNPP